ncbi:MAG: repressor LexA [Elusimicrobia bacterium]|nr:repressor LexA [Elusimicrobiota bacterium]
MTQAKLNPIQNRILKLLERHIEEPLSYRDLAREVGVASTNTIAYHLRLLEKKGCLKRDPVNPRSYAVLTKPETGVAYLNLYGLVHCGPNGSILDGSPIDRIPVAARLIPFQVTDAFLVKAKGDSMEPRIFDGDLVLVKKQAVANSGDIVVCANEGEAIIKKMRQENGNIILISLNQKYEPFLASKEEFRVEGTVKTIISWSF